MQQSVRIFDTTLRDGEQTPAVHMTTQDKSVIANRLEAFGVATIEAGFPISSPGDEAAVARVAREVTSCEVAAMARCKPADVEAAARALEEANKPVIHVFLGTSDQHLQHKLRMTRAEAIRAIEDAVAQARRYVDDVQFSAEDATRTERTFLRQCIQTAVEAGANRINVPDTVGWALPQEYGALIRDVSAFAGPGVVVSAHCHNDMGLATANTIAAVEAGAGQVEVTVNGIGERAGNTAIEEVGVVLEMKKIARSGLDLSQIASLSSLVVDYTSVPVQPNRPVVGANAFAHSSGIHQDGIVKDPRNYAFIPPEMVGVDGHRIVMTARSGRSAIAHIARRMGVDMSPSQVHTAYAAFIAKAEQVKGAVPDEIVQAIIEDVRGATSVPETVSGNQASHPDMITL